MSLAHVHDPVLPMGLWGSVPSLASPKDPRQRRLAKGECGPGSGHSGAHGASTGGSRIHPAGVLGEHGCRVAPGLPVLLLGTCPEQAQMDSRHSGQVLARLPISVAPCAT